MKYKVGDKVRVKTNLKAYESNNCLVSKDMINMEGQEHIIEGVAGIKPNYKIFQNDGKDYWWFTEEMLEPADSKIVRMADGTIIGEFNTGGFCDGFRCGKIPVVNDLIVSPTEMERAIDKISDVLSAWTTNVQLDKETIFNGLSQTLKRATEVYSSTKEEKNLKFTFYFNVNEGTRVDKSCNGTIPTITTSVVLDKFGDPDRRKCYSLEGEATCDKVDYDMRQGVLEALANAVFDGNFEKAYDKAVKTNAFCERQDRTCHYCGQLFDTIAEKEAHEAWHVERKKARHERYLLRKRAKEIAFEEAAQKMAKEMIEK